MAKGYWRFVGSDLNTVRALRLFADFAGAYPDHVRIFHHIWIKSQLNLSDDNVLLQLLVEDLSATDPDYAHLVAFKEFCKVEADIPDPNQVGGAEGADLLLRKLPTLLEVEVNGNAWQGTRSSRQYARHLEQERLFVMPVDVIQAEVGADPTAINERAQDIFRFFQFHATAVKVATPVVVSPYGRYLPQMIYLYYILNDLDRGGSTVCEQAAVQYPGGVFLECYETSRQPRYRVAVASPIVPHRETLDHFCRLLINIPGLLGNKVRRYERVVGPFLAGVYVPDVRDHVLPADEAEPQAILAGNELLMDLGTTKFVDDWRVRSPFVSLQYTPVSMSDQPDVDGVHKLKENLEGVPDSRYGYRLRLERSNYQDLKDRQSVADELTRSLKDIQFRLAELRNTGQLFPRLLRFTTDQIGAMMDVMRTFPLGDLEKLLYAFQASNPHPTIPNEFEFSHYILIDDIVQTSGLNLLKRHKPTPGPVSEEEQRRLLTHCRAVSCTEFWFDPFWASTYRNRNGNSYLFVPYQTRLSPPLHVWEKADFDRILHGFLSEQFKDSPGWKKYGRPIYLFDGDLRDPDTLTLTVFDHQDFKPVLTPDVIPLLNDNVNIVQSLNIEGMVRELSEKISENKIMADFETKTAEKRTAFEKAAVDYAAEMAQTTRLLTNEVTGALNSLMTDATALVDEANELNKWLKKARAAVNDMRRRKQSSDEQLTQTTAQAQQLKNEIQAQLDEVDEVIEAVEKHRDDILRRIKDTTDDIKRSRADLEKYIEELHDLIQPT